MQESREIGEKGTMSVKQQVALISSRSECEKESYTLRDIDQVFMEKRKKEAKLEWVLKEINHI